MSTTNYDPWAADKRSRGDAASIAGSGSIIVTDGRTEVDAWQISVDGGTVSEPSDGIAEISISAHVDNSHENATGGTLLPGTVVVVDASGDLVTTTTPQDTRRVGVVVSAIADGDTGPVAFSGYVPLVLVTASVTAGDYLETSSVAGEATENPTRRTGSFGIFETGGTTPTAWLFGIPDSSNSSASGASITGNDVTPPLTLALPPRVLPTGSGTMRPHSEGRITDDAGDNRYSQGIVYLRGVLHHFYTEGATEHASDTAVWHRKSYDYGVTWGTAASIYSGGGAGRHGNVEFAMVTSKGRIIVGVDDQANANAFDVIGGIIYSDNQGGTWSSVYTIPNTFSGDCVPSACVELANGDLFLLAYGEKSGYVSSHTHVRGYRSTDGGATFGSEIVVASSASRDFAEPRAVVTDGDVVVLMRCDTNVHTWRTSSPVDDCVTWGAASDVLVMSGPPDVIEVWPGALWCVGRNNNSQFRAREAMSWDKGLTWTSPAELDTDEIRELDGTALWLMGAGAVYAIYALLDTLSSSTFYIRRLYDGVGTDHLGLTDAASVDVTAYREVLMTSGITNPPDPLISTDGTDWLYGVAS